MLFSCSLVHTKSTESLPLDVTSQLKSSFCRFHYTWQQRWHQLRDLPSLFRQQTAMHEQVCAGSAMNLVARLTGHILFFGVWYMHCQNPLSMHCVCSFASESERGDSSRTPGKRSRKYSLKLWLSSWQIWVLSVRIVIMFFFQRLVAEGRFFCGFSGRWL